MNNLIELNCLEKIDNSCLLIKIYTFLFTPKVQYIGVEPLYDILRNCVARLIISFWIQEKIN